MITSDYLEQVLYPLTSLSEDELPPTPSEKELLEGNRYEHFRFVADKGQQPLRIDKFLQAHIRETSRSRLQKAAEEGYLYVNGREVKVGYKVKPGDVVTIEMNTPRQEFTIEPEDIPLDIVYEDDEILVINKQAGLVVHPGVGNHSGTLLNAIAWHLKDLPGFDANNPDVGLVHRIDKDTTGLLLIAKTPDAKTKLGLQFYNKTTSRRYVALIWGDPGDLEGRIEGNIGRDINDRTRMAVFPTDSILGKPAVTHYKILRRYGYTTFVECILETGRTHQIRVHMKHIGHPLFSDATYGGDQILRGTTDSNYLKFVNYCFELCPRQALHAKTLGFVHPKTGETMSFDSPLPSDMQQLVDAWEERCINR